MRGNNILYLDKNIPYLEGRVGGTESLNQKNLPRVVFEIPGPPWYILMLHSDTTTENSH